jgi:uncharacterized protein
MKNVLIDTSYLVALANPRDTHYAAATQLASQQQFIGHMPEVAIAELFYVLRTRVSYQAANRALQVTYQGGINLISLTKEDFIRVQEIMTRYQSREFDFVDSSIMALSERLSIDTVFTFDRRDYPIFRPKHISYLTLLP